MQLVFLGTSAMVPTKDRNHSACLLLHAGEGLLIDCGEGTQRQLKMAGVSQAKITRILITHWHGDHVLGLPGLLMTMSQGGYTGKLHIYGPKGMSQHIRMVLDTFVFDLRMELEVHEIARDVVFDTEELHVVALPLDHGVPCLGYRIEEKDRRRVHLDVVKKLGIPEGPLLGKLQRGEEVAHNGKIVKPSDVTYVVKGKTVTFVTDTAPCKNAHILAENATLLVCEASFESKLEEKAEEYTHMTAKQAADLATRADVEKLIITHFSARYADSRLLLEEAKTVFPNTLAAYDLMRVALDKR